MKFAGRSTGTKIRSSRFSRQPIRNTSITIFGQVTINICYFSKGSAAWSNMQNQANEEM